MKGLNNRRNDMQEKKPDKADSSHPLDMDIVERSVPTFDTGGDISEKTANLIGGYTGDPWEWLRFCTRCWDQKYGTIAKYEADTSHGIRFDASRTIKFITGGWSCNELVIQTMQENTLMWTLCWESSHKGGCYFFECEKEGSQ